MCAWNTFSNRCTQFQHHSVVTCGEWLINTKLLNTTRRSYMWVTWWTTVESHIGHGLGHRGVTYGSHNVTYGPQMGHRWTTGWIVDGYRWVTNGSHVSRRWVTYWLYFQIQYFSSSPNSPISDSVTTLPHLGYEKWMQFWTNQEKVT